MNRSAIPGVNRGHGGGYSGILFVHASHQGEISMNTIEEPTLEERVCTAIDEIRPSLQADGGDIEFVALGEDGTVSVKLVGACAGCPMSQMTLSFGVEKHLKKTIPEVTSVVAV
jgi:Fe-S cluster biogenesis protein NfuA